MSKIKTLNELVGAVHSDKERGRKVVWTNGCFDLFHITHVDLLRKARAEGDELVVGLN